MKGKLAHPVLRGGHHAVLPASSPAVISSPPFRSRWSSSQARSLSHIQNTMVQRNSCKSCHWGRETGRKDHSGFSGQRADFCAGREDRRDGARQFEPSVSFLEDRVDLCSTWTLLFKIFTVGGCLLWAFVSSMTTNQSFGRCVLFYAM